MVAAAARARVARAVLVLELLVPGSHRFTPVAPGFGRIRSRIRSRRRRRRRVGSAGSRFEPYQLGAMGNIPSPPNDLEMQFQSSY